MHQNIPDVFKKLSISPAPVVIENVRIWEERLTGKLPLLRSALGNKGREIGLDSPDRTESQCLRTILLSAVVTAFDPFESGAVSGSSHRSAIAEAADALGVAIEDVKPLSTVEVKLYDALAST